MNLVVADVDHEHDDLFVILILVDETCKAYVTRQVDPGTVKASKRFLVHILARYVLVAKCLVHCL
jgi:hypothetical protein